MACKAIQRRVDAATADAGDVAANGEKGVGIWRDRSLAL